MRQQRAKMRQQRAKMRQQKGLKDANRVFLWKWVPVSDGHLYQMGIVYLFQMGIVYICQIGIGYLFQMGTFFKWVPSSNEYLFQMGNYSHRQEMFYKFVSKSTNKLVKQLLSMTV